MFDFVVAGAQLRSPEFDAFPEFTRRWILFYPVLSDKGLSQTALKTTVSTWYMRLWTGTLTRC